MKQIKSVASVFVTKLIAFVIFLVLLIVSNLIVPYVNNYKFTTIVDFLNSNLYLIIIFTILFLIAEMFEVLSFPLDLPGPLFNGVGSIFLIKFLFLLLKTILILIEAPLEEVPLELFYVVCAAIVFIAVIIAGYVNIFSKIARKRKLKKHEHQ